MTEQAEAPRVVRVLPDVVAIDRSFDYVAPEGAEVHVGDVVRIDLHGRRVRGWIVAVDVEPEAGVALKPLAKVSGRGPEPALVDLAGWAAQRWLGRRVHLLRTASPPGVVRRLDPSPAVARAVAAPVGDAALAPVGEAEGRALAAPAAVLRLGPGADRYRLVRAAATDAAARGGQVLVLCPSVAEAGVLGRRLRRDGVSAAVVAHDQPGAAAIGEWTAAAAGRAIAVVGARAAAWAPAPLLRRVVVLDEHEEVYQQEQAPTWHARDVAVERARRAGAPCLLVSPCPSLEALAWGELITDQRALERRSWPRIEVVDQRELDPTLGPLFSPRLVDLVRGEDRVLCVLNRTGRVRLLACSRCATLARCERCDAAVSLEAGADGVDHLACGRCGTVRPVVCSACGGQRLKNLRLGVSRAREELEALAGTPVAEVTALTPDDDPGWRDARILVGTEAVLHRVGRAGAVAFLDFDQELLSLRYRAAEEALGLLARAGRIVQRGAGDGRGLVLVQTRTPEHPVLMAAHHADPGRLVESELPMRRALGLPPATALALISGPGAPEFVAGVHRPDDVRVQGPVDGTWRVIAPDHGRLAAVLAPVPRPPERLRIEVDPLRA